MSSKGRSLARFVSTTGISTVVDLNVTRANVTGVSTVVDLNATRINVSGVSTVVDLNATRINVSGVVTFAQSNPTNLNVSGISTTARINIGTGGTVVTTTVTGFVGIGSTNPTARLDVRTGSGALITLPSDDNETWVAKFYNFQDAGDQNGVVIGNRWAGPESVILQVGSIYDGGVGYQDGFDTGLLVRGDTKVGVGTTNPIDKLHVFFNNNGAQFSVDNGGQAYTSINLKNKGTRKAVVEWDNTNSELVVGTDSAGSPTGSTTLWAGGSKRVIVDSVGRVRMPNQTAFQVRGDYTGIVTAATKASWSTSGGGTNTTFDRNGDFSNASDRFTAPVNGVYQFNLGVYKYSNASSQAISWTPRVNGGEVGSGDTFIFYNCRSNTDDDMLLASWLMVLSANDYVEIFARSGSATNTIYSGHTWWGGYLIG